MTESEFDVYAEDYDQALAQGLAVSGEDKNYFARGRIAWLSKRLQQLGIEPRSALDFGCGTGSSTPFLFELLTIDSLQGVDVSKPSLQVARDLYEPHYGADRVRFTLTMEAEPSAEIDLAFCNGVFHHIIPEERDAAGKYVFNSLRPGSLFAFWENNPWNPGTRYVMSQCPFDCNAQTITPPQARSLLKKCGFEIVRTDFLFIFPRVLAVFRFLEPSVCSLPLGTQYMILARKPQS